MSFVLDACAVIAYLRREDGSDYIKNLLFNEKCIIHAVNLCEVYYDCLKRGEDDNTASELIAKIEETGTEFREDLDRDFWKRVGSYRAKIRQIPLNIAFADCFVLDLAEKLEATIVTSDRDEFEPIKDIGLFPYKIEFFR